MRTYSAAGTEGLFTRLLADWRMLTFTDPGLSEESTATGTGFRVRFHIDEAMAGGILFYRSLLVFD